MPKIEEMTMTHDNLAIKFFSYEQGTYTFLPKKPQDLGTWRVSGIVSNEWSYIKFSFKIKVTNDSPRFSKELVNLIIAEQEKNQTINLPLPFDPEGQNVSVATQEKYKNKLPKFVRFN